MVVLVDVVGEDAVDASAGHVEEGVVEPSRVALVWTLPAAKEIQKAANRPRSIDGAP